MQSNGGVMSAEEGGRSPIRLMESGPAAGSIGAAALGKLIGQNNLITFNMGGTTTKASVIEAGEPLTTVEFELFEAPNKPGSGWPIRVPMIDLCEAGAGGGSIAWLDREGNLQVGPQSAGAEPGPVCYGKGGTEPHHHRRQCRPGPAGGSTGWGPAPRRSNGARRHRGAYRPTPRLLGRGGGRRGAGDRRRKDRGCHP